MTARLDPRHLTSFFAAVTLVTLALGSSSDEKPSSSATPAPIAPRPPDETDAWIMTKQFVKKALKSPSTADFGSVFGEFQDPKSVCTSQGQNTWRCAGWVDSQNSFGAMLRTNFVAVVQNTDGDNWQLKDFSFK